MDDVADSGQFHVILQNDRISYTLADHTVAVDSDFDFFVRYEKPPF
jgi:hypothetical protein